MNHSRLFWALSLASNIALGGCSQSSNSSPDSNNPFVLRMLSSNKSGTVVAFNLQITNDTQPVRGAKLTELLLFNNQHDTTETLNIFSDSLGTFNFSTTFPITTISVAFRAIDDSLVSNYVTWP